VNEGLQLVQVAVREEADGLYEKAKGMIAPVHSVANSSSFKTIGAAFGFLLLPYAIALMAKNENKIAKVAQLVSTAGRVAKTVDNMST